MSSIYFIGEICKRAIIMQSDKGGDVVAEDQRIELLEAEVNQLKTVNLKLLEQLEILMEIVQQTNPALAPENVQRVADNQVIAQKIGGGGYQPM